MNYHNPSITILNASDIKEIVASVIKAELSKFENKGFNDLVVLTRNEAAAILKVTPPTISQYIKIGVLTNRGSGKKVLILKRDIDELINIRNIK